MSFTSLAFLVFFLLFFLFYWLVFNKKVQLQNVWLLTASYFFYGWTDWRFLLLLVLISFLFYFIAHSIYKSEDSRHKKRFFSIGLVIGVGTLFFFKYFNFFIASFNSLLGLFGLHENFRLLNIIVPLGISFFIFRALDYLLDIYKDKIKPANDPIIFFSYVAFFPSLLSGPIDKAKMFIPQLEKERSLDFSKAVDGARQILWGLFKKIVIADQCAEIVNMVFGNYSHYSGSVLLVTAVLFTFQVYTDFSGYSDMAIGIARLLGFEITRNFDYPFFSQNIVEFWSKWHISLTSWMTEHVFTPLTIVFRDYGKLGIILAVIINFTIVGIWHGASWNYIVFGFINGCLFIPFLLRDKMVKKKKIAKDRRFPSFSEWINLAITYSILTVTFIVFRSDGLMNAFRYISRMLSRSLISVPVFSNNSPRVVLVFIAFFIVMEWLGREKKYPLENLWSGLPIWPRWLFYFLLITMIFIFLGKEEQFIYFQF